MGTAVLSLDALRERIREIEGHRVEQRRDPSGVPAIDDLIGGLPAPGILEISGPAGSGRLRIVAELAARFAARGRTVAWVDPRRRLHPPGLVHLGVDLGHTLMIRPPADRDAWAVEQIARSGCFPMVVVLDPLRRRRAGVAWSYAVEQGGCVIVVVDAHPERDVPACVRLGITGGRLVVMRDRNRPPGRSATVLGGPW